MYLANISIDVARRTNFEYSQMQSLESMIKNIYMRRKQPDYTKSSSTVSVIKKVELRNATVQIEKLFFKVIIW